MTKAAAEPREPEAARRAYEIYEKLGPGRSLDAAWQDYRARPTTTSRGRPRTKKASPRRASGQWTKWSTQFHWRERAAAYDNNADGKRRDENARKMRALEQRRLKVELALQDKAEEQVAILQSTVRKLDQLPSNTTRVWTRHFAGRRKVASVKDRVQGLHLTNYAAAIRSLLKNATLAIIGPSFRTGRLPADTPSRKLKLQHDRRFIRQLLGKEPERPSFERLPGESARAFEAFRQYRDSGPKRSLDAAWRAAHPETTQTSSDGKPGRRRLGHWNRLSSEFQWQERAQAYDDSIEQVQIDLAYQRSMKLYERRKDFEIRFQPWVEEQVEVVRCRIIDVTKLPVTTVSTHVIDRDQNGNVVCISKTSIEGLQASGLAMLARAFLELMRFEVVGPN